MQSGNVLEVNNLITEFSTESGPVRAVNGISFSLAKGETLGIVGESGSGKSVTSLSLMRLLPIPPGKLLSGEAWFRSPTKGKVDLLQLPGPEMRQIRGNEISMIFQEPMTSLNPVFTCGFQVIEAIMAHMPISKFEAAGIALRLFNEVQLPRPEIIFKSYPHQISGGQKQRVMIAMAMACNPAILIADEPTTALDVSVQKTILELMLHLQSEKQMSIIFITHDLGVIAEIADKVIVMYKGSIVETGSTTEIFEDPKHPYTKGLLACRPRVHVRMKILPTVADFMTETGNGDIQEIEGSLDAVLARATQSKNEYLERQVSLADRMPVLEVENLVKHYPRDNNWFGRQKNVVKAVDGVSFRVFDGETLGLVGESGCGKTTLGRAIIRLIEPDKGSIRFLGNEIMNMGQRELRTMRRDMQIIFQDPYSSLNPRMTIGNAILEPMEVHGLHKDAFARKEKVFELLEKVSLRPEHFNRYPHEFSGGQRQRVCIARALAMEPRLVICDESVSALDVSVQAQVLNLLRDLQREFKFTYIFISHDLSVVKYMSDRMMVMHDGKIKEMGYTESVYNNPQESYTKKLIDAIPKSKVEDIKIAMGQRNATRKFRSLGLEID